MNSNRTKECPVCGFRTLRGDRDYSICSICMWQDDPIQTDDPDFWGGANSLSLNDYREKWLIDHKRVAVLKPLRKATSLPNNRQDASEQHSKRRTVGV